MDKKIMAARKPPVIKARGNLPSSFIALGNRPGTPETSGGVRRDAASSGLNVLPLKKLRLAHEEPSKLSPSTTRKDITTEAVWQNIAVDVNPTNLMEKITSADSKGKRDKVEKILCGVAKLLYDNRAKAPDPLIFSSLLQLAQENSSYFQSETVTEGFCALLRKPATAVKILPKTNRFIHSLVTNSLYLAFEDNPTWPELFIKTYLDDALGERLWVDRRECAKFVETLETAFGTQRPSADVLAMLFANENRLSAADSFSSPQRGAQSPFDDHESGGSSSRDANVEEQLQNVESNFEEESEGVEKHTKLLPTVQQHKFTHNAESIRQYTVELLRDMWSRRQDTISKSLLKTMAACCGYSEVRLAASQKLDNWLQNAKFHRVSVELMLSMCLNCKEQAQSDFEVIQNLIKLRLKTKPLINNLFIVLKELFNQNVQYLGIIMKLVVHNELSVSNRAPHNMLMIGQCFQFNQQLSSQLLADVCFEFLMMKDDYIRALRGLLKEIVRVALKFDFPFVCFCEALCSDKADRINLINKFDFQLKERLYRNVEDLIALSIFLGISPSIKEAALSFARGDKKDASLLRTYQQQVSAGQLHALNWLQNVVPLVFKPNKDDYLKCFLRVLFLEKPEFYSSKDNWPSEPERNLFLKIIGDAAINEDVLIKILTIGLSPNLPLNQMAAIDLTEQLVKRAAFAAVEGKFATETFILLVTKIELIDLLLNCCTYRPRESLPLPQGYVSPLLAIAVLFWRVVFILLILGCHNPTFVGSLIWEYYPTLCLIMQMIMTDDITFPPSSAEVQDLSCDDIKRKDLQVAELERQEILELECHLSQNLITETNSALLQQLMRLDLKGPARRPPPNVLEQLKSLNQQLNLGLLLCRSRNPDFLLEIINRQGASHSLPWLVQLIQKNEGSLSVLPVQCLCEFLLHQIDTQLNEDSFLDNDAAVSTNLFNEQRMTELRQRLRNVLWNSLSDLIQVEQTLMYFVNRLQADTLTDRIVAAEALNLLTKKHDTVESSSCCSFRWLQNVTQLPNFDGVKLKICYVLLKCCLTETQTASVYAYVEFLSQHMPVEFIDEAALIYAKMICERKTFFEQLFSNDCGERSKSFEFLLNIFNEHLKKARKPQAEVISWSANQEQLIVQWGDISAVINVQVVAAMMLLLGLGKSDQNDFPSYDQLFEMWFPENTQKPTAFLVDTTEEAELIPDWVKIRLLESKSEKIVNSVLSSLDDSQIVIFLQTYGLPKENVSKLLAALDKITINNEKFLHNMKDRWKSLADFVNSYRILGATGGDVYLEFVQRTTEPNVSKKVVERVNYTTEFSTVSTKSDEMLFLNEFVLNDDQIDATLEKLFNEEILNETNVSKEFATILSMLASTDTRKMVFNKLIAVCQSIERLNNNSERFCVLLCAMDRFCSDDDGGERERLKEICNKLLQKDEVNSNSILVNICRRILGTLSLNTKPIVSEENFDQSHDNKIICDDTLDANKKLDEAEIDVLSYRLLTEFAKLAEQPFVETKLENIDSVLRQLAFRHPKLLVRQLPLIAALLRGNTSYTMKKYYNSTYLLYFMMVLGLLEILRPHIFERNYSKAFMDIADSFFDFIENHGLRNPKMVLIIDKILALLTGHHAVDPETSTKYLESWASLIQAISIRYPELPSVKSLMTRVNLPLPRVFVGTSSAADASGGTSVSDTSELKPLPHRPPSPVQVVEVAPILNRIKKAETVEEMMTSLKDLGDFTLKKSDALAYCKVELEKLVTHRNKDCCKMAFELLMKYFRIEPREAEMFLPKYLSCFNAGNDVAKTALSFLPDYCRIYSKNPGILLEAAFSWGIKSLGKDVIPFLCEAVSTIHQNTSTYSI